MPRHILFASGGPSAGTAFNYQKPDEVDFASATTNQLDATGGGDPRNFQSLYDGNGGAAVGLDFAIDSDFEYTVFGWYNATLNTANNGASMNLREGVNVSTTDASAGSPGTRIGEANMEGGSSRTGMGMVMSWLRPSGSRDAEWAVQFADLSMRHASIMAISNAQLRPKIIRFPDREIYPSFNGLINRDGWDQFVWSTQSGSDVDTDSEKKAFTIPTSSDNEEWLMLITGRNENNGDHASGLSTDNRYTPYLDGPPSFGTGVDIFNVRTNNITAGATKTGRGFNWNQPTQNFEERNQLHVTIKRLPAGEYNAWWRWNQHQDNSDNITFDNATFNMWRLNHFRTWSYHQITDALTSGSSGAGYVETGFTTTIDVPDADSKLMIIFATNRHGQGGLETNDMEFRIQRDGQTLVDTATNTCTGGSTNSDSDTIESTDNMTAPVYIMWYDQPGAGSHTYTVQLNVAVSSSMYNRRDDGSAGYEGGLLFVGELNFAQDEG